MTNLNDLQKMKKISDIINDEGYLDDELTSVIKEYRERYFTETNNNLDDIEWYYTLEDMGYDLDIQEQIDDVAHYRAYNTMLNDHPELKLKHPEKMFSVFNGIMLTKRQMIDLDIQIDD